MTQLQLFLLVYLVFYYGAAFFWRSYRVWRTTGINPYRINEGDSLHRTTGRWLKIIAVLVVAVVFVYAFLPEWYVYLGSIVWLENGVVTAVGITLLLLSLTWVLRAQSQMGDSWRIGIDAEHETALVTRGVYGRSRNPIFLGMRINLLGLFLVMPSAVTLTVWLLGDVLIQIQVYLEEAFLRQQHGRVYEQYCHQVPRWLKANNVGLYRLVQSW